MGVLNLPAKPVPPYRCYIGKSVSSEKFSVAWCETIGLLLVRGWNGNCSRQCMFEIRHSRKQKLLAGAGEGDKCKHILARGKRGKRKVK